MIKMVGNKAVEMTAEEIAEFEAMRAAAENSVAAPEEISRRQFYQGLAVAGKITKAEAISAIQGSALPAALQAIVDNIADEDAAFEATMLLLGAGSFFRSHPLILVFAMAQAMTQAQVDEFWRLSAAL